MNDYDYKYVKISDLYLDDENPRFASSVLVNNSSNIVTQQAIIEHLVKYADISKLACRINSVHGLHASELVTCIMRNGKYIVVEGNRRICACKLLLDRNMIPKDYIEDFPVIDVETRQNLDEIMVAIYVNRAAVQPYLSDRHIAGVKKWSALEKNNYYMNLFQLHGNVKAICDFTSDSISTIKRCVIKYQFFMKVYNILKEKHKDIEIEKLDYLPMVDRFMDLIVGTDAEVGLALAFDDETLQYVHSKDKEKLYYNILQTIGEAFLIRQEKKRCKSGELDKIISSEISNLSKQKKLILDDIRIPGLLKLIMEYKEITAKSKINNLVETLPSDKKEPENQVKLFQEQEKCDSSAPYIPEVPKKFVPKKSNDTFLCFLKWESENFNISNDSEYGRKILSLIRELSILSVYDHPCSCALLYRTLIELCTKYVFSSSTLSKEYNESDLKGNVKYLVNTVLFSNKKGKDIPKIKQAIQGYLNNPDIIQTLNLYIHYANPVDEQFLLSSWKTLKMYIAECLSIK